jgi:hypothetical protein
LLSGKPFGLPSPPLAIGEIAQRMFQKFLQLADWGAVATIAVLSLVPGDLRPHTEAPGYLEHVAAYFITAILLSLGYLRWSPIVIIAPLSIYAAEPGNCAALYSRSQFICMGLVCRIFRCADGRCCRDLRLALMAAIAGYALAILSRMVAQAVESPTHQAPLRC